MRQIALVLSAWLTTERAWAHGLGQRYDLPIPLPFYLLGAAAAVAASFAFLVLFRWSDRRTVPMARHMRSRGRIPQVVVTVLETCAVAVFVFLIAAGLLGNESTP